MSGIKLRLLACTAVGLLGCAAASAQAPAKSDAPSAKAGVAAYIGSEAIKVEDLDARALKTNMKLAQSLYDARKTALEQVILERILAADATAKGVTVDQLIRDRIAEKVKPVTDAEIEAFYKANTARMGGKPLEQMSGQIRSMLVSQQEKTARDALLAELMQKAGVKITLEPPRVEVAVAANDPTKGPANAKVTIVEFSEFQ